MLGEVAKAVGATILRGADARRGQSGEELDDRNLTPMSGQFDRDCSFETLEDFAGTQ